MGRRGIRVLVNDSYKAGAQNWTDTLPEVFARRRGYDQRLWLPAMTGRIIGSAEAMGQGRSFRPSTSPPLPALLFQSTATCSQNVRRW
jgi:hypothetical protein